MKKIEYISIGISIYNAEKYLADAIKSVLAQSYPYWELILVDDGSIDCSLQIAQSFASKDNRIRVISDGLNKKLPARLNQIIREAKYDYIARMDADDLMAVDRLEKQINILNNEPKFDLVSTGILSLNNDLSLVGYRGISSCKKITLEDAVLGTTGIIHASVLARKEWFLRNMYNESNRLAEDYELWLIAFLKDDLRVKFVEEPLYFYREDQSIKIEKLLQAYSTQSKIIGDISSGLLSDSDKNKYMKKIFIKKIIVRVVFMLKLEFLLHKRRVDSNLNSKYSWILEKNLSLINK